MYRHRYSDNFNDAATDLITQIYQIFPDSHPGSHARRGIGHPNIRCRNLAKSHTLNGKKIFNGVNVTHTECYFYVKEWAQLGTKR